jgi:stage II sporulation protein AB (anti-sigma F factor)
VKVVTRNRVVVELASIPENVGVARLVAAMVAAQGDFTVAEVDEVKLAVSEAVTNAVIHGYGGEPDHVVVLEVCLTDGILSIVVADQGVGIADIPLAMQPAVSSDPERMGLGFCFMESHMDTLQVDSAPGRGTRVAMTKKAGSLQPARAEAN